MGIENMYTGDLYDWEPWKTQFAWLPTRVPGKTIWFKKYYTRIGYHRVLAIGGRLLKTQQTTDNIFDVLKS